jgi:hypothetical protein
MKKYLILWLYLFAAVSARAQGGFTTVTAIVKDASGNIYAGGRGNASFIPSPTATASPLLSGSTFQTDVPIPQLDSFGAFTLILADNAQVSDGHTGGLASQWRFNICSSNTPPVCFTTTMTITGATQNITAALQAAAAPLPITNLAQFLTLNNTWTGSANTFCRLVGERHVDQSNVCGWTGADYGAWVNSAVTDLPSITVGGNPYKYGTIRLDPVGTFPITQSTAVIITSPFVNIIGPGKNRLVLSCTVNGNCWDIRENPFNPGAEGGHYGGFTILGQGSGNANAVGIHTGDMVGATFYDLDIDKFTGANSSCMWFDNGIATNGFFERNWMVYITAGRSFQTSGSQAAGCTKEFRFTNTGNIAGDASFGHNNWYGIANNVNSGQIGWSVESNTFGAQLYFNFIQGQVNMSGGTLFSVTSTSNMQANWIDFNVETSGAAVGWSTAAGVNFHYSGPGIQRFSAVNFTDSISPNTLITPTEIVKNGSGGGSYTGTNTTFANVDTTNLCQVITIPAGWKLKVGASGLAGSLTASVAITISISDIGATCAAGGTAALKQIGFVTPAGATGAPFTVPPATIIGDGNAHAISLQAFTGNVADAWFISNGGSGNTPSLSLTLVAPGLFN